MAYKWANIHPPVPIIWRVIPEDPAFPTENLIVASVSMTDADFANPLPANPSNQDCTASFQEALDSVAMARGYDVKVTENVIYIAPLNEEELDSRSTQSSAVAEDDVDLSKMYAIAVLPFAVCAMNGGS